MDISNALIFSMNFGALSGDLAKPLERHIGRPIRHLGYRALAWRAFAGVLIILILLSAAAPGSWTEVMAKATSPASLPSLAATGVAVFASFCCLSWITAVPLPVVPRSANPRYYRDTGVNTRLVDNWLGVLFQDIRLQGGDRTEAIRTAIGEITQHASPDATDANPNAVALSRALSDSDTKLATESLRQAGLLITPGSLVLDGMMILLLLSACVALSAFLTPLVPIA